MIQVSKIIEGAKAATGLSNFGPDGWQEGLEILTDSANREADLNEMGVASFTGQCTMFLMRRLEIEDWYARHPEIDEEQIVAPLDGARPAAHRLHRAALPAGRGPQRAGHAQLGKHGAPARRPKPRPTGPIRALPRRRRA